MRCRLKLLIFLYINVAVLAKGQPLLSLGKGEEMDFEKAVCISNEALAVELNRIEKNIEQLIISNKLSPLNSRNEINFQWPLKAIDIDQNFSYYGISNFVDHDESFPNKIKDYNCGLRTFDTQDGYNHPGTDIFLYPFGWYLMEKNAVEVVAAADGVIIERQDNNFDKNCSLSNAAPWNVVYLLHENGFISCYGHLKKNSLTHKKIGDKVTQGEFLGLVGSSGASSGPHLHFEIRDAQRKVIDPFQGNCSKGNSLWLKSIPYFDSGVNRVSTHYKLPNIRECKPEDVELYEKTQFCGGDTLYLITFLRDQLKYQLLKHKIIRPDGSVFATWTTSLSVAEYYSASYWYMPVALPYGAKEGTWMYSINYLNQNFSTKFEVCPSEDRKDGVFPNPIIENEIHLMLSCEKTDNYAIAIYDANAKQVYLKYAELFVGQQNVAINLPDLSAGVYYIFVTDSNNKRLVTHRFLKF